MKNSKVEGTKQGLNDIEKCHINFLYKLHFFNQDFHNKINGNRLRKMIVVEGASFSDPILTKGKEDYAKSRRVELKIVMKETSKYRELLNFNSNKDTKRSETPKNNVLNKQDKPENKKFSLNSIKNIKLPVYSPKNANKNSGNS